MANAKWILTKLGDTGIPIICSSDHPDRTPESYDVIIGQSCFEKNWNAGKLINISENINLSAGYPVLAFKEFLEESGVEIPA
jgi:hypothetical protein